MQKPELTRSVVEGSWSEVYRTIHEDLKPFVPDPTFMSKLEVQMAKEDRDATEPVEIPFPTKVLKRENTNGICKRCSDFTCSDCIWV